MTNAGCFVTLFRMVTPAGDFMVKEVIVVPRHDRAYGKYSSSRQKGGKTSPHKGKGRGVRKATTLIVQPKQSKK